MLIRLVIFAISLLCAFSAFATDELPDEIPHFDITEYRVEGNTLLEPGLIETLLVKFTGKDLDFGTVQEALEALEKAYRDCGYSTVQVALPEQELEKGIVLLRVLEARIGKVSIEGNKFFDEKNIRNSLPELREGYPPNTNALSMNLALANESPAKKITLELQNSDRDDEINATVKVKDEKSWKAGVTIDNTGNSQTGSFRIGALFQHANIANIDNILTLQFLTSPEKPNKVGTYSLGYRTPLYKAGGALEFVGAYSDVNSGVLSVSGYDLHVSGKGIILGVHYKYSLARIGNYEHNLNFGIDYRAFENSVDLQGMPLGNNVTVHPVSLTYSGNKPFEKGSVGFYLTAVQNLPGGIVARDSISYFQKTRFGADVDYYLLRYGANAAYVIGSDWQGHLNMNGQYALKPLVPGEQFGLGGAGSIRGFQEREVTNDAGYSGSLEIYTPDIFALIGIKAAQCRVLAFYDRGYVSRRHPLPEEMVSALISGAGLGFRIMSGNNLFVSADYGLVVDTAGIRTRWSGRWHLKAMALF